MMEDAELLDRYARERTEDAFAELVRRHVNLVYSAALRQVGGNTHAAEDVTQGVFTELARQAGRLTSHPALTGWLYTTTRRMASHVIREDQRRLRREQEAQVMQELLRDSAPELDWSCVRPVLDDAMYELNDTDRLAVLLRCFEGRELRAVGAALGLSENAARMRVDRALDKLRDMLAERGVGSTSAALALMLAAQAVAAAPSGLAAAVTGAALSAAVSSAASTIGILMVSTKLKIGLALGVAAGMATTLVVQHQTIGRQRAELSSLRQSADERERLRAENAQQAKARITVDELARLRAEQSELHRLRGEVSTLRQENRQLVAAAAQASRASENPANGKGKTTEGFIPAAAWRDVGTDTPDSAFQSFLATLETGDPDRISSSVEWDIRWRNADNEDDKKLVEKSKQDYLEMLQRAREKLAGFRFESTSDVSPTRKRVFFSTVTTEGSTVDSSFEMTLVSGQWKPVLSMWWREAGNNKSFATSPVFGTQIDLPP